MNRFAAIIIEIILLSFGLATFSDAKLNTTDGIVAYYKFENNLIDSSGNGNHISSHSLLNCIDGAVGKAVIFDTCSQTSLNLSNGFITLFQPERTVAFWLNPTKENGCGNGGFLECINVHSNGGGLQSMIAIAANYGTQVSTRADGFFSDTISNVYNIDPIYGVWTHYAITVTESNSDIYTIKLYINGSLVGSQEGKLSITERSNPEGYLSWASNSAIDELIYYNRSLSSEEIKEIYTEGTANNDISFQFSDINLSQSVSNPFPVTIKAISSSGYIDTDFNKEIDIYSSTFALINPHKVTLINGEVTFNMRVLDPGLSMQLSAYNEGISGVSNFFQVNGNTSVNTSLQGIVKNDDGLAIPGARVDLISQNGTIISKYTDQNGLYYFSNIQPGYYKIEAEFNSKKSFQNIAIGLGQNIANSLIIKAKRPVVLVPGIMGSDSKWKRNVAIPELPKETPAPASKLKIHDPWNQVGFENLASQLSDSGYSCFECPYDWRLSPFSDEAVGYLSDCIDRAIEETGYSQVDVVAHSMGGLLTRTYIQQTPDDYKKIEKFAMVGTPNNGSTSAFIITESGDTILQDSINHELDFPIPFLTAFFYTNALKKEWKNQKGFDFLIPNESPIRYRVSLVDIYQFIHSYIKSLPSLFPTYEFIKNGENLEKGLYHYNHILNYLNKHPSLSRIQTNGSITTKIFLSNNEKTLTSLEVKPSNDATLWKDGEFFKVFSDFTGDGTVPSLSGYLPNIDIKTGNYGPHSALIKNAKDDIIAFLNEGRTIQPTIKEPYASQIEATPQMLHVSVDMGNCVLVIGPDGAQNGLEFDSQTLHKQEGATVFRDTGGSSVSLPATTGNYTIKVTGNNRTYPTEINIGYGNENLYDESAVELMFTGSSLVFSVTIDTSADPMITLNGLTQEVEEIASKPSGATLSMASLTWKQVNSPSVTGYKIYGKLTSEPVYTFLSQVDKNITTFTTNYQWEVPNTSFIVVAQGDPNQPSVLKNIVPNYLFQSGNGIIPEVLMLLLDQ